MPPERKPFQKRRQLPFKPPSRQTPTPGPSTTAPTKKTTTTKPTKPTKPTSTTKANTKPKTKASSSKSLPPPPSESSDNNEEEEDDENDDENSSRSRSPSTEPTEPEFILAEINHGQNAEQDVVTSDPAIPGKLLTKLVHQHFKGEKSKIAKDANEAVAKYVDVFVREAIARAAFERAEGGIGDGFLEVEDLEKMAPQLVLDF
ncbi:CENP-S associating centromere protein X-domain-containing protein [Aspergillus avenaceus]|uniref:CENP-S associating centromere protein X-domain-containing protein n=1 Tax=Aspergillus avenaceus TaxID=36643 RepID=A0A5N6TDH4_ASPAV|nr:CENP-S associating centromere protein X-domain-containing protein [Aspergillus avenaceus]